MQLRPSTEKVEDELVVYSIHGPAWAVEGIGSDRLRLRELSPGGRRLALPINERIRRLALSPDGKLLAVMYPARAPARKQIQIWDLAAATSLPSWTRDEPHWLEYKETLRNGYVRGGEYTFLYDLAFSPDGKLLAAGNPGGVFLWDVPSGRRVHHMELTAGTTPGRPDIENEKARSVRFSRDGRLLFSGGNDGHVDWGEVATGRTTTRFGSLPSDVISLATSRDGRLLAAGDEDGTVHLWDIASRSELASWGAHQAGVTALTFSADGAVLASGGVEGTLKLWNLLLIRRELTTLGLDW